MKLRADIIRLFAVLNGLIFIWAITGCAGAARPEHARPNILVILVDDMGYSDLGCYGSEIKTPNLDRLARQGIRYTQMYNTSKCWTTRISLLTGLYHHRSGRDFERTSMVSEVLGPAGYRMWWSGKHHASFNPYERGFDHFRGFLGGAINYWNPGGEARPDEPIPAWRATYTWAFDDKLVKPFVPDKSFYATDAFTDWALEWLDEPRGKDEPFFLYIAYNAPHWPLHAHPEDIAKYDGVYDVGYEAIRQRRYKRQLQMGLFDRDSALLSPPDHDDWSKMSPEDRGKESKRMAIHAAMVDRVDQNVGRLVKKLDAMGELQNTLILFLVDNGASAERPNNAKSDPKAQWGSVGSFEAIGRSWANAADTPLRKWKVTSHEGGINTAMIAHWPVGITAEKGSICRETCHLIDLLPTWMELAGERATYPGNSTQPLIPSVDGVSLMPTFRGEKLNRAEPLYFQYGKEKAMRDGPWKLVRTQTAPWELYDLSTDRTETRNLSIQYSNRVQGMVERWHEWYKDCTGKTWKEPVKKPKKAKSR